MSLMFKVTMSPNCSVGAALSLLAMIRTVQAVLPSCSLRARL